MNRFLIALEFMYLRWQRGQQEEKIQKTPNFKHDVNQVIRQCGRHWGLT